MFRLLKNADCYTPQFLGKQDVLTAFDKIAAISANTGAENLPFVQIIDCTGKIACPGFIDQHLHIAGGGGEKGPASIIGPICPEDIAAAGVTTFVGLLGADGLGKSVDGLLMKARQLESEGFTSYIYTGNYGLPPPTITGSVLKDIALVDKVIGAGEIAISDYRSSNPSLKELSELAYEAITGGMLGKKAGVLHLHVGDGKGGLAPLINLLENSDFPVDMFVPTHLNRNSRLFGEALGFHEKGGIVDLTAGENPGAGYGVPECLKMLIAGRDGLERVTVSSDGNGSNPGSVMGRGAGNDHGSGVLNNMGSGAWKCAGSDAGSGGRKTAGIFCLFGDIKTAVKEYGIPMEQALKTVTENVAKLLKLHPVKGSLSVGADADILLIDKDSFMPDMLFARGRMILEKGRYIPDAACKGHAGMLAGGVF